MSDLIYHLFSDITGYLPMELLSVFYLCFGLVIVKAIVDIFLLFVRWLLHVR